MDTKNHSVLLEVIRTQTDIARLGLDLGGIMSLVTERAQLLTRADGAATEFAEEGEMVYRAATGVAASQLGLRIQRDGSLSGLCVTSGDILCCDDSDADPRVDRDACKRVGLRSMVVVPLKHGDAIVGVLKVMASAPFAFTQDDSRGCRRSRHVRHEARAQGKPRAICIAGGSGRSPTRSCGRK